MTRIRRDWSESERRQVEEELARILAGRGFAHSDRQRRLLAHIVAETLAGREDRLKGYTLAVEVLGRGADFDPAVDPVVRVEANRLRAKLRDYYLEAGQGSPVRISLPKGAYAAAFEFGDAPVPAAGEPPPGSLSAPDKPSLAVLPFTNMSADPEQDYFADGITEDLITDLSKISGLFVIARHSVFVYKSVTQTVERIGAELGVRYLLEGSVRRFGDRIRVSAQLVDAAGGRHLWADRYDRQLRDLFAVQDDLTRRIVAALKVTLAPGESDRLGREGTRSIDAYDHLLRGLQRFWIFSRVASEQALAMFRRAVQLDPHYPAAHAWLARALVFRWVVYWCDPEETLDAALAHARRAVELDDQLPFAHAVLGWVRMWMKDGEEAVGECRRAVALDPNSGDARLFLTMALSSTGRSEEGLEHIAQALRLNPHPPSFYLLALGICRYNMGDYRGCVEACERGVAHSPLFIPNHVFLALAYHQLGEGDRGRAARDTALELSGGSTPVLRTSVIDPDKARDYEERMRAIGLL